MAENEEQLKLAITKSLKKDELEKIDKNNLNIKPSSADPNKIDSKNSVGSSVLDLNNLRFENFMEMEVAPVINSSNTINKMTTNGQKNNIIESGLLSPKKKTMVDNPPELFTAQKSYIDEQNSQKLLSFLSIQNESLVLPPTHPIYEKKETKTKKFPAAFEDHELNEKSKKKINPEIFVQLKVGTISNAYKIGQLIGEGTYDQKLIFLLKKMFSFYLLWKKGGRGEGEGSKGKGKRLKKIKLIAVPKLLRFNFSNIG